MLSEVQFEASVRDLELMFGPIEQDSSRRDSKISVYYDRLKFADERILSRAVKYLIDVHAYKRFPLVQEVRDAISQVTKNVQGPEPGSESLVTCEACHGTGHRMMEKIESNRYKHTVATPCQCREGDRVLARWRGYNEKQKQGG